MSKLQTKKARNERRQTLHLVEAILNKDLQKSKSLFKTILNNKLGKQISKIAKTTELI